jgi:hypothetical protein
MATSREKTFSPGVELEPAPRLAGRMEIKAVLGHDWGPNNRPEFHRFLGRNSQGQSQPEPAPDAGFILKPAYAWSGLCYSITNKIV